MNGGVAVADDWNRACCAWLSARFSEDLLCILMRRVYNKRDNIETLDHGKRRIRTRLSLR